MAAKIAAVLVVVAIQVVALLAVAVVLLGWRPGDEASPLLVVAAAALGAVTFAALGLLLAGTLRAEAVLALANGLFLAALLVGGLLVPAASLPAPLGTIAGLLPSAALAELLRIGLGGQRRWARSAGSSWPSGPSPRSASRPAPSAGTDAAARHPGRKLNVR